MHYEATGSAPTPTVTNHAVVNQYVHCTTAEAYVWLDETDANPIENSIYNNTSGFTHDYYSGMTALATDPMRCLGITPAAWATGGPVSMPGELRIPAPAEKIHAMRTMLQQLVQAGTLRRSWRRPLEMHLDHPAHSWRFGRQSKQRGSRCGRHVMGSCAHCCTSPWGRHLLNAVENIDVRVAKHPPADDVST